MTRSFYWVDHSTQAFTERDLSKTVVVLPIAAVEQHGPHLPVDVDAAINAEIIRRTVERLQPDTDVLFLPPMAVGKSDEHTAFPGTLAISGETLRHVWLDLARSVKRAGAAKLILFNSHGGQMALMDIICRDIRIELGMLAVSCSWFRIAPVEDLFSRAEIDHGIHGGDIETSMMLAIAPERVAMDKAEDFIPLTVAIEKSGSMLTAEGAVGFGWQAQDLHPAGVCGNAANATAQKGQIVLDRAADGLVSLIAATQAFDLSQLTSQTRFSNLC
ncbi:creatininase family protein [Agrobacterium vitis]|uniref:creatininase family protein n=1 Tax=Allorhizobium ampelinum TaxID=3025782 RepID=UPI001F412722|nr:creatininase family protein [Allorhizobium ampelinum]MCF1460608.1 creatininase family protein [Allorhizobium ampelinum]